MTTQAWIILTAAEAATAVTLNDEDARVDPREVTNPLADNLGEGVLVGKSVLPARLLNDALYARWLTSLGTLPIRAFDSDVLFVPDDI